MPSYNPTTTELKAAISSFVTANNKQVPDAKTLKRQIVKKNPTWRLPERRVQKLLKQQGILIGEITNVSPTSKTDESTSDEGSHPVASNPVRTRFKGIYKSTKKLFVAPKESAPAAKDAAYVAPPMEVVTESPAMSGEAKADDSEQSESMLYGEKLEMEEPEDDKGLGGNEGVYQDDNDGKRGKVCAPCEGCILM